jgi:hypothetical protein
MGIMLSMSGYSDVAVSEASGRRTPLMLMDHRYVYFVLGGSQPLEKWSMAFAGMHHRPERRFCRRSGSAALKGR